MFWGQHRGHVWCGVVTCVPFVVLFLFTEQGGDWHNAREIHSMGRWTMKEEFIFLVVRSRTQDLAHASPPAVSRLQPGTWSCSPTSTIFRYSFLPIEYLSF